MILNTETFARIAAMNPQYEHVAYSGGQHDGTVKFQVSNQGPDGMTTESEYVFVTEEFVEVRRKPVWRTYIDEEGKSGSGDYPIAPPPSTLTLARRSGLGY